ncbi:MAG: pectin acetylesterase-family hydrolase [Bacteroidota bacterium]
MKSNVLLMVLALFVWACANEPAVESTDDSSAFLAELQDSSWNTIETGGTTRCADGSDYYFMVRKGDPKKVVLYFQGGGACWDAYTCANPIDSVEPNFYYASILPRFTNEQGIFNSTNPKNPVKDWTIVAIPYCTGDVHLGNIDQQYALENGDSLTIHHRGLDNTNAVLDWIKSQQFDPEKVFLCGTSAGGYGSITYVDDVLELFQQAKVYQMTDCSVLVSDQADGMADPWNATPLLDHGVEPAADLINASFQTLGSKFNDERIKYSQLNSMYDEVMFFYYMVMEGIQEPTAEDVGQFATARLASIGQTDQLLKQHYIFSTDHGANQRGLTPHTFLQSDRLFETEENGIQLVDWLTAYLNDEEIQDVQVAVQ